MSKIDASETARLLRVMSVVLVEDGSISEEHRAALVHAASVVEFVGRHADGLRALAKRLSRSSELLATPESDAELAQLPEVAAVLKAFPGSAIETVQQIGGGS